MKVAGTLLSLVDTELREQGAVGARKKSCFWYARIFLAQVAQGTPLGVVPSLSVHPEIRMYLIFFHEIRGMLGNKVG